MFSRTRYLQTSESISHRTKKSIWSWRFREFAFVMDWVSNETDWVFTPRDAKGASTVSYAGTPFFFRKPPFGFAWSIIKKCEQLFHWNEPVLSYSFNRLRARISKNLHKSTLQ